MTSHIAEESIAIAPPVTEGESKQSLKPRKLSTRTIDFFWRRGQSDTKREENQCKIDDSADVNNVECKLRNVPSTKMSFDFFRNIKKHMHIKSLTICKSKQKSKAIEAASPLNAISNDLMLQNDRPTTIAQEPNAVEQRQDNSPVTSNVLCDKEQCNSPIDSSSKESSPDKCISQTINESFEYTSNIGQRSTEATSIQSINETEKNNRDESPTASKLCSNDENQELRHNVPLDNNTAEPQINISREIAEIQHEISDSVTNDHKVKASLTKELLKLSKYGWYWGPISGDEADAKLISEPDGAFLVRDSSDDRYILTLSFKSSGKLLHARIEHTGGLFSLCNQSECDGFSSVAALIKHSMNFSQSAVFCYSRPKYPGYPSFPVRLTKPVSRFTQVRSLQYLCRFVIRQNTRLDNIHKLPLPTTIKGYIEEAHY